MRALNGKRRLTWRSLPVLVAGLLAGAVLMQPAVAHVKRSLSHLTKHLDPRYYNVGEKVGDADTLDGVDSSGFARAGAAYTKAESDARYEPFDSAYTKTESDARYAPTAHNHDDRYFTEAESDTRYVNVGETATNADTVDGYHANELGRTADGKGGVSIDTTGAQVATVTITAPRAGQMLLNAAAHSIGGSGCPCNIFMRLREGAVQLPGSFFFAQTLDNSPAMAAQSNTEVVSVTAGAHTYNVFMNTSTGTAVAEASISATFVPFGPTGVPRTSLGAQPAQRQP